MRAPTRYERFLDKRPRTYTDDYDDEENLKEFAKYMRPIWEYSGLYNIYRKYANIAYNTTTAKGYFEKLLSIEYKGNVLFPPNLVNCGMEIVQLQKELAQELLADRNKYFINDYTLSKNGCRMVKEYADKMYETVSTLTPDDEIDED